MALFAFVLAAGAAGGWGITVGSIGAAVLRAELAAWNSDRTEERSPLGVLTALAMHSAMLQQPRGGGGRCPGGQRSGRRQRRQPR